MVNQEDFNSILRSFNIKARCISQRKVRHISLYDLNLAIGTRVKDVSKYLDEISMALKSYSKPVIKIIPQEGIIQMEVVDDRPEKISFIETYEKIKKQDGLLPLYIGNSVSGDDIIFDLAKNPHTLIAGATGSGKSVLLHTIIGNIMSYDDVITYIVDPKNIEFENYKGSANINVCNNFDEAIKCLVFLNTVMEERYKLIVENSYPVNYFLSNQKQYPKIVLIIDEFADLLAQDYGKTLHKLICQLAQKSRAAGIFCILATQRPSVSVISGEIKANFPARISCQTASMIDSRVILDAPGAEHLIGSGDAIIKNYKYNYTRFQSAYTTPEELVSIYNNS